ncbi:MAG: MFS transporter [Bacilli bacterium]
MSFILAGLVGQLAWTIENMYLNRYLYDLDETKLNYVTLMVALSAIVATVTTLLMGILMDRLGKRKMFISFGYIIWGITIILFGVLQYSFITHAALLVVIMDCIMTFFGSTANDAGFNAYVTDNTDETNGGIVECILSILPLVSMLLIVGLADPLTQGATMQEKHWDIFFYIFGVLVSLIGVVLIFLLKKDNVKPNKSESYFKTIFYGFRVKTIKNNKNLYLSLVAFMIFNIAIQIFFPYFLIYIEYGAPEISGVNYTLTLGIVLLISCIITVVIGLFMDGIGKNKLIVPSLVLLVVGCVMMFIFTSMPLIIVSGTLLMTGYMLITAIFGALIRDYTPKHEVGLFQGIRMIFTVLIPMIIGPYIGQFCYSINKVEKEFINEYGNLVTGVVPNGNIFLGAAIVSVFSLIPIFFLMKNEKQKTNENAVSEN